MSKRPWSTLCAGGDRSFSSSSSSSAKRARLDLKQRRRPGSDDADDAARTDEEAGALHPDPDPDLEPETKLARGLDPAATSNYTAVNAMLGAAHQCSQMRRQQREGALVY